MAKLSELIMRTAAVTGTPEATVREISRRLREGGLIQTGKGGRYGGADMTPRDVACLLSGLLIVRASSVSFADIASVAKSHLDGLTSHIPRSHRMIPARWDRRLELSELCKLKVGHGFGEAFAGLIASFANGEFEQRMTKWRWVRVAVTIYSPRPIPFRTEEPEAAIEFETEAFGRSYLHFIRRRGAERTEMIAPSKWSDINEEMHCDLSVGAEISSATLKSLGLLLQNSS
jgi:hypothetical protein